jgi:hypothetical protein
VFGSKSQLVGVRWALFFVLAGCSDPATQLVVEVDTDYRWPDELRFVDVSTVDEGGIESDDMLHYELGVDPSATVPFSFGVAPKEGEESLAFTLVVEGRRERSSNRPLVTVRAKTGFIEEKSLYLGVFLAESCEDVDCEFDETCFGGECVDNAQPPEDLNPYDPNLDPPQPMKDGGVADTGVDAGEIPDAGDGGVDGGAEDVGVDGGLPDNCTIALGEPIEIGTAAIPFEPTLEVLAANLDGDSVIEFVVASAEAVSSPFAVIDFDDCDDPVVTSTAAYGELRQGLLFENGLFAAERNKISRWSYAGPNAISEVDARAASGLDIERLAFGPDDRTGLSVVDLGAGWTYSRFDPALGFQASLDAPARPRGASAFFRDDLFLHGDDLALRLIDPGAQVSAAATTADVSDPAVVDLDDDEFLFAARAVDEMVVVAWRNGAVAASTMVDFGAAILAGPIAARTNGDIRFYALLVDGTLTSCTADEQNASCSIDSGTKQFAAGELDDRRTLLSAFIDSDDRPDIVFVGFSGRVFFQRGDQLANDAAPAIDLLEDNLAPPAIAIDFFAAYGRQGSLLVVPHDGTVSLVPFAGRDGGASALWPQHRRDRQRSARLP